MHMRFFRKSNLKHRLLVGVVTPSLLSAPAMAQETAPKLGIAQAQENPNEILVVAERRRERLQDIPVAITSLSAEALDRAGIESTLDLSAVTPGLNFTSATGSAAPFLRGVGNNSVGPGAESSVATYVDGVYYASVSATVFSLTGVQQIDVLKGPQGTLFGRNATGGVIQITTLDPDFKMSGKQSLSFGNYDTIGIKTYITGEITNTVAANFALAYDNQLQGYGTNLTTGNDANSTESLSFRAKLLWEPSERTKVILASDYSDLDSSEGNSRRPPYGSIPALGPVFTGGKQDIYSDIDSRYRSKQGGVSIKVEQDLGFAQLLSISAFRREVQDLIGDRDFGLPIATTYGLNHKVVDQYSQELQLLGPANSRVRWVGGLYIFYLDGFFDPVGIRGPALAPLTAYDIYSGTKALSGAAFGQITIDDVLPSTDLTIGGRYTIERRTADISQTGYIGAIVRPLGATTGRDTWRSPSWRLSLSHKFSSALVGYLSYNRGFKSGIFNLVTIPAEAVRPEILDAYEAGLKLDAFDRRLKINMAAFYYDYRDMQVPRYTEGTVLLSNAGKARMYGLDMDASVAATPSLRFTAGLSLLNAKYKEFDNAVFSVPRAGGGNIISFTSAAGNRVMLAPRATANLGMSYTLPGALDAISVDANYYYNNGWFANPNNRLRQASFNQVNASLNWISPDRDVKITLWGRNLTNEIYAQYLSETDAISDTFSASAPRTYGVTLKGRF